MIAGFFILLGPLLVLLLILTFGLLRAWTGYGKIEDVPYSKGGFGEPKSHLVESPAEYLIPRDGWLSGEDSTGGAM